MKPAGWEHREVSGASFGSTVGATALSFSKTSGFCTSIATASVQSRSYLTAHLFKGYEDRTLASALTNRTLWFDRNDIELPDGVCFNDDLLGLKVVCEENGVTYGVLDTIEENITGFYYIVKGGNTSYRVPDVEKYILRRSVGDAIYVSPLEGLEI